MASPLTLQTKFDSPNAVARPMSDKVAELGVSFEDFGAVGDYNEATDSGTDDTAAIRRAIEYAANDLGGGVVRATPGKTYLTTSQINVLAGIALNLNYSKIVARLTGGNDCALLPMSNTIVENGHIKVLSNGTPGGQTTIHAPIRVGPIYGDGGTVAEPSIEDNVHSFILRNLTVESTKDLGLGASAGASGIGIVGNVFNGLIENIFVPPSGKLSIGISLDWGIRGKVNGLQAISSNSASMTTNRTNFEAGNGFTTHPHNIVIRNIVLGKLSRSVSTTDTGTRAVRMAGCYGITVDNVFALGTTEAAFLHHAGDLGFEFASPTANVSAELAALFAGDLPFALMGNRFSRCFCANTGQGHLIKTDSNADNVERAIGGTVTGTISNGQAGAGTVLTVTSAPRNILAVGQTITGPGIANGTTITALGTGSGSSGTYTVSVSQLVPSTAMTASFGYTARLPSVGARWPTDVVFEQVHGKSGGVDTSKTPPVEPADGIYVFDQDGGTIIDCSAIGYKTGVRISGGKDNRIVRGRYTSSRNEGIYVNDRSIRPVVQDIVECARNNLSGGGFSNCHFESSQYGVIDGGCFGAETGETARHSILVGQASNGQKHTSILSRPTVLGHGPDAEHYALVAGSSSEYTALRLFEGIDYGPGVTRRYAGQKIVPIAWKGSEARIWTARRDDLANQSTPTGGTWVNGDEIRFSDPIERTNDGSVCVVGGTPGSWEGLMAAVKASVGFFVAGSKVVSAQQPAIADLTVSATLGSLPVANGSVTIANAATPTNAELLEYCRELEAKIEASLAKDRAHGLIA